jgi:hypothetical protein
MCTFPIALFFGFPDFRDWLFATTFPVSSQKDRKGSVTGLSLDLPYSLVFKVISSLGA